MKRYILLQKGKPGKCAMNWERSERFPQIQNDDISTRLMCWMRPWGCKGCFRYIYVITTTVRWNLRFTSPHISMLIKIPAIIHIKSSKGLGKNKAYSGGAAIVFQEPIITGQDQEVWRSVALGSETRSPSQRCAQRSPCPCAYIAEKFRRQHIWTDGEE